MIDRLRHKLTYANAMATVAVFGVLAGGGAWAAATIGAGDIKSNAVRSKHVKNRSLVPKDSRGGAIAAFAYVRDVAPAGASAATLGYGRRVTDVDDPDGVAPYTVTFASSVRKCIVQAVPGAGKPYGDAQTSWSVGHPATVDMSETFGPRAVQVYFRDSTNTAVDTSFLITAIC